MNDDILGDTFPGGPGPYDPRLRRPLLDTLPPPAPFEPDYTPQQMLDMGVFGGAYFAGELGAIRRQRLFDGVGFLTPPPTGERIRGKKAAANNYFGKQASFERDWWLDRGLIFSCDPLGWFEWYCWHYAGRRVPGHDNHQIRRWLDFRRRQLAMYRARPSEGLAQALLHWGIACPYNEDALFG